MKSKTLGLGILVALAAFICFALYTESRATAEEYSRLSVSDRSIVTNCDERGYVAFKDSEGWVVAPVDVAKERTS